MFQAFSVYTSYTLFFPFERPFLKINLSVICSRSGLCCSCFSHVGSIYVQDLACAVPASHMWEALPLWTTTLRIPSPLWELQSKKAILKISAGIDVLNVMVDAEAISRWIKNKGSPWHLVQSCLTLGRGAHPRFQAIEPAFVWRQFPWSHDQRD